ncbi:MAG: PilZ domain-containing protein [Clostridiales bacterium]|nr:PilZ domain-containing protein [Clostridiales bacterium]
MGFLSSLFGRSDDYEEEEQNEEGELPQLYTGMTLDVETVDGERILTGRLTGFSSSTLTLERLPGGLSLAVREIGTSVVVRGLDETMTPFYLKGAVQESTRVVCKLKDVKVKPIPEHRHDFRLRINAPVAMYYPKDTTFSHPEECLLVDISTGGACVESEYLHAVDEVLRLKVKLEDYAPMEFLGEIIRVVEYQPGKFRYGFLFAQLKEKELTELTRTLYNLQAGNRSTWVRTPEGHW